MFLGVVVESLKDLTSKGWAEGLVSFGLSNILPTVYAGAVVPIVLSSTRVLQSHDSTRNVSV